MNEKKQIKKIVIISIPFTLIIFILKYYSYYIINSTSLYSDALESAINIFSAISVFFAVHLSMKPADNKHPFGHYKAEYFSSILEGIFIIISSFFILYKSYKIFYNDHIINFNKIALIINIISTIINFFLSCFLIKNGRKYSSPSITADGQHLLADVFSSIIILFGFIISYFSIYNFIDNILAIIFSIYIFYQGCKIIYKSIQCLMDTSIDNDKKNKIKNIIYKIGSGAIEMHDLKTRLAGRIIFIEFHLVVPSKMTVGNAHLICDRIESAIYNYIKYSYIIIHIEPENKSKLENNFFLLKK